MVKVEVYIFDDDLVDFIPWETELVKKSDHDAAMAKAEAKLKKAVEGLEKAKETMGTARQTAFESHFRDILWSGTDDVVKLLKELSEVAGDK